jgi:hypothetical protein
MLDTVISVSLLTAMEVVGPLLLAAALAYGSVRYRRRNRAKKLHTEAATKALYREGARQERREEASLDAPMAPKL